MGVWPTPKSWRFAERATPDATVRRARVSSTALRAFGVPLAVACGLWATAQFSDAHAQQAAVVGVDEVRAEPLSQTVPVIGRLVARQSGVVAARTGGPVKQVPIKVGDRVQKGDVLAMIDTARIESEQARIAANLVEAKRQVESAQAQAKLRQQELARLEGLRESVAFSQGRFEDSQQEVIVAQSAIAVSQARLQNAEANLAMADLDLDWAVIRAPYPGVITVVHTEAGAWLNVGEQVVSMVNDQDLEIEADVPSNRILGLDPGIVVNLKLDDETEHLAIVRAIVPGGKRAHANAPGPLHAAVQRHRQAARRQPVRRRAFAVGPAPGGGHRS